MKNLTVIILSLICFASCNDDDCRTCTKTIGGVAGNITDEIREVCSDAEATKLEESSSGTTVWTCE